MHNPVFYAKAQKTGLQHFAFLRDICSAALNKNYSVSVATMHNAAI